MTWPTGEEKKPVIKKIISVLVTKLSAAFYPELARDWDREAKCCKIRLGSSTFLKEFALCDHFDLFHHLFPGKGHPCHRL